MIIIIALLKKKENSQNLNLKSPEIREKFKHGKITRSTEFYQINTCM